jgi:hypothetical protein
MSAVGLSERLRNLDDRTFGAALGRRRSWYFRRAADLNPGDRVVVTAWSLRGQTGTLLRPARLPNGKPAWLVRMDDPKALWRGRTRVAEQSLSKVTK